MQEFSDILNRLLTDNTIPKRLAEGIGVGIATSINVVSESIESKIILFEKEPGTTGALVYYFFHDDSDFSVFINQCISVLTGYQNEKGKVMDNDG